ncbi:hypothetical protein M7I_6301 [Glarea lozoyensis 74030]|uniref:Uncharacterized protein n=1 Tax=Glarea lozoyensis (strain ATCC 74030 / MF5533) TaxID=1104152 RepID=H0EU70_GLAL7|nr:hypothetical protein M7I_6301 [Glarea lozoyensis 74030]
MPYAHASVYATQQTHSIFQPSIIFGQSCGVSEVRHGVSTFTTTSTAHAPSAITSIAATGKVVLLSLMGSWNGCFRSIRISTSRVLPFPLTRWCIARTPFARTSSRLAVCETSSTTSSTPHATPPTATSLVIFWTHSTIRIIITIFTFNFTGA